MKSQELVARKADLQTLAEVLKQQGAGRLDARVPAGNIQSVNGVIQVNGLQSEKFPNLDPTFLPSPLMDGNLAEKLGIPVAYLRRLREERPDLYDANVNGWLRGAGGLTPDARSFLLRSFVTDEGPNLGRALLSNSYRIINNEDTLFAALDGIREAGVQVAVHSADLSERRMLVRLAVPEISELAPDLLENYNPPEGSFWDVGRARAAAAREGLAYEKGKEPVVFAGLAFGNSETGGSRFFIVPEATFEMCGNRLRITADSVARTHLGAALDDGVVEYSEETQRKNLELIRAQTKDAVSTFLNVDYMRGVLADITKTAKKQIDHPVEVLDAVAKELSWSPADKQGILDAFVKHGQADRAGGVLQAVTLHAQNVADPDVAYELENQAIKAMDLAAAAA